MCVLLDLDLTKSSDRGADVTRTTQRQKLTRGGNVGLMTLLHRETSMCVCWTADLRCYHITNHSDFFLARLSHETRFASMCVCVCVPGVVILVGTLTLWGHFSGSNRVRGSFDV